MPSHGANASSGENTRHFKTFYTPDEIAELPSVAICQGVEAKLRPSREYHTDRIEVRTHITNAVMMNVLCAAARMHEINKGKLSISEAKSKCREEGDKYTLGVLSSGGMVDTMAAIHQGFRPLFGTEVCDRKRAMWRDLTCTEDLGDTFKVEWEEIESPDLLTSGQTCIDYSSSGPKTGEEGTPGWMFTSQVDPKTQGVCVGNGRERDEYSSWS